MADNDNAITRDNDETTSGEDLSHGNFDFRGFDVPDLKAVTLAGASGKGKHDRKEKAKGGDKAKTKDKTKAKSGKAGKRGSDEHASRNDVSGNDSSNSQERHGETVGSTMNKKDTSAKKDRPGLFTPIAMRGVTVRNRIWLPPMCTYSAYARDGRPTPFHYQHYVSRAFGGFGMVIAEATAVAPEGRISPCDLGLWEDGQIDSWRWIVDGIREAGAVAAVQLNHAGRKASTGCFAVGYEGQSVPQEAGGWPTVAPSDIPFGALNKPRALSVDEIHGLVGAFAAAAGRAMAAGFQAVEIHAAHGYLISQFLDPLINERDDEYGGDLTGRSRFLMEVVDAVRGTVGDAVPVLVRVSATDWAAGGWDLDQTIVLARMLKEHGVDLVDVSTGGMVSGVSVPVKPNYQVPFAEQIKIKADVPVSAVGLITKSKQAAKILSRGEADVVEIGRAALRDPYWPLRAANKLGVPSSEAPYAPQYVRGAY
ncbi:NADH:flavin oxidoreductase/NADH oxidase [Bifidobacterium olomucense]|uniref:NADH-dependent flavin oxidoreductase n=1 Tax=Bifidobacterium olomucense TaxID=2675324 RepID=A0A7Y0EYL2_9BIFI|nr:NADH:flavin oxidoreductase/NADH oxidase [Bifidobacterium sp. DSM 109959]NMM98797.1 NADH-dependent flavin oxidoreductase [Bifidobacterium sp. DSM 109959]